MKLRAPEGCRSVSLYGEALAIPESGSIVVDEAAASILVSHGFALCDTVAPDGPEAAPTPTPDRPGSGSDEVDALGRRGLFALLRSKGVPVSLPITNRELRAAARRALAR